MSLLLKSLRLSEIFAWTFATLYFALALFFEPLTFLDNSLCRLTSFFSYSLRYCGEPDLTPSEVTQTSLMPTSMPIALSVLRRLKT